MRKLWFALAVVPLAGGLFAVDVFSRKPLTPIRSTTHPSISRTECIDCHAAIAAEWRQSFHYRSLTSSHWNDVRKLGYQRVFDRLRKPCVNCHAPANVLDLVDTTNDAELGVECTPNLLENPKGTIPAARFDDASLGVDCVACHVSKRGIVGTGRRPTAAHATIADRRFQDPIVTSEELCRTCHRSTVEAWKRTPLPAAGVTCVGCHMPGGSHRFAADKDAGMLAKAVHASMSIDGRKARFQITNDHVGHYFPSGGNALTVHFTASDASGRTVREMKQVFMKDEALLLDFWPFNRDTRIAFGERRDVDFALPPGHGTVQAVVRYHDWMREEKSVLTLAGRY